MVREKHECTKIPDMTIPNKSPIHFVFNFRFRSKLTSEKDNCTHEIGQITVAFCSAVVNNLLSFFFAVVWSERLLLAATAADCGGCHDGDVMQMGMSNITKAVT